jgi:hypothetical protein
MKKITKIGINFLIVITSLTMTMSCDNQSKKESSEKPTELDANKAFLKEMEKLEKESDVQITDEMIEEHIKNDPVLMNDIKRKAETQANKEVDKQILNAPLEVFFKNNPQQLDTYKMCISTMPTKRNNEVLLSMIMESIEEINNMINDIQTGKINVNVVPKSLQKLLIDLKENEKRVREFQLEK